MKNKNPKLHWRYLCFSRKLTSRLVENKNKEKIQSPMVANRATVHFPTN